MTPQNVEGQDIDEEAREDTKQKESLAPVLDLLASGSADSVCITDPGLLARTEADLRDLERFLSGHRIELVVSEGASGHGHPNESGHRDERPTKAEDDRRGTDVGDNDVD